MYPSFLLYVTYILIKKTVVRTEVGYKTTFTRLTVKNKAATRKNVTEPKPAILNNVGAPILLSPELLL